MITVLQKCTPQFQTLWDIGLTRLATMLHASFPGGRGGGYSHIWTIWGCSSTGYGFCLSESGTGSTKISVSVWNRVYFLPFRLWNTVRMTILLPESRYKRTLLLFPLGSRCTFTQTRHFRLEGELRITFFSLETGIYFHHFVWNRVGKLRLFSLEQGQVIRHSAAHPILNWGEYPPPPPPLPQAWPCSNVVSVWPIAGLSFYR